MNRRNMNFLKGLGLGMVAGGVIGMLSAPKKSAGSMIGKYLRGMGEMMDRLTAAMGL